MSSPDQWLENAIIFGVYPNGGGGGGGVTARQVQEFAFNYEPATGANDAFVVNLSPAVTVLTDGLIVSMSSGSLENDTDSPTLQINALPPVDIVLWAGALAPGDIEPGASYLFIYNEAGNTFQLINPSISTANAFLTQSGFYNAAIDAGAANAYVVTLNPTPLGSFGIGFPIYMKVGAGNTNTGASTITVNGELADITLNNGSALPAGALLSNAMALLLYNGGGWTLINPILAGATSFGWHGVAGTSQACSVENGYIALNGAQTTFDLPATAALGSVIAIQGHSAGGWVVNANTGQTIFGGSDVSTSGGSVTSQAGSDNIYLLCVVEDTEWRVTSAYSQGLTYA